MLKLNNIVDNIEQCGQQNIVHCCFHQAEKGCSFFAVALSGLWCGTACKKYIFLSVAKGCSTILKNFSEFFRHMKTLCKVVNITWLSTFYNGYKSIAKIRRT